METLRLRGNDRRPTYTPRYSVYRASRHRVARAELGYRRKVLTPRMAEPIDFVPAHETQEPETDLEADREGMPQPP
jgi:hypothetical protein